MPIAIFALTAGAFGIGTTEFVIMGLLLRVADDLGVTVAQAGLLVSAYAIGVAVGAPLLTLATRRLPRKEVLLALLVVFVAGNLGCALAPGYRSLLVARVVTSLAHGTFFGVGSVVATSLVPKERRASAISVMFTGLTLATLLGVPAGAWLGQRYGFRATFVAVALVGVVALAIVAALVPRDPSPPAPPPLREELSVLARPAVWLALAMTVLGFGGVFVLFTFVEPLLRRVSGVSEGATSAALVVFGAGLALGNVLGGKIADRAPTRAVGATLVALAVVLAAARLFVATPASAFVYLFVLGVFAFATVSPLQLRVLERARGAGQNLASSLNIAAFNLGNALGAWVGALVIDHGPGLRALGEVGAIFPATALVLVFASHEKDRRARSLPTG